MRPGRLIAMLLSVGAAGACDRSPANPRCEGAEPGFDAVSAGLADHCQGCHSGPNATAGFRADVYDDPANPLAAPDVWALAARRVASGSMPPGGGVDPGSAFARQLQAWAGGGAPEQSSMARCLDGGGQPAEPRAPTAAPLNRLSKLELQRTLARLMGDDLSQYLDDVLEEIPDDDTTAGYRNMVWTLTPSHISAYADVADRAADVLTRSPDTLGTLAPCLKTAVTTDECVNDFITTFGARVFRRPLTQEEIDSARALYVEAAQPKPLNGIQSLIQFFLQAPAFLYKIETGGTPAAGDPTVLELDSYSIASRLSYALQATMPDAELFAAAAADKLRDPANRRAQAARLLDSPEAKATFRDFASQWLLLARLSADHYSPEFLDGIPVDTLAIDARDELLAFVEDIVWRQNGTFADLLTSTKAFPGSSALRRIYGVPDVDAPNGVDLETSQRSGILTRVAALAQGTDDTSPVKRGALVLRQLLCEHVDPPDAAKFDMGAMSPPDKDPTLTTRERWARKTSPPACASCHDRLNPAGYAMEDFDSLGRWRSQENGLPIDTSIQYPELAAAGLKGTTQLSSMLAESPVARNCFIRQWLRHERSLHEVPADMQRIRDLAEPHQGEPTSILSIRNMILQTTVDDEFIRRRL